MRHIFISVFFLLSGCQSSSDGTMMGSGLGQENFSKSVFTTSDYEYCALRSGNVNCYGPNTNRQSNVPHDLKDVTEIAMSRDSVCAISHGKIHCWGNGYLGHTQYSVFEEFSNPRFLRGDPTSSKFNVVTDHGYFEFASQNVNKADTYPFKTQICWCRPGSQI